MRASPRERWRYWFDNTMSRGTPALIGLLALASTVLVAVVTVLVMLFAPGEVDGTSDALWRSILRTLDPGTMGGDQGSRLFLTLMLVVTVGGIFIVSSLVGVLASGLDNRLAELRKGKSRLVEYGHTVVPGWSDQLFTIIAELAQAGEGERACVTILADRDKVEMEDQIRLRLKNLGRLRVVCRTGNPAAPVELDIVRPDTAAVIIVPTPDSPEPDVQVIKTLLALQHRSWPSGRPPVVASIAASNNLPAAALAGPDVTFVDAEDVTARLIVQSRRHPGLSAVCTDLLGFTGQEIHTRVEPDLTGTSYGQTLCAYATATVLGIRHPTGTVSINPPADTCLQAGDELIVLAPNRTAIKRQARPPRIVAGAIDERTRTPEPADATLILGWNNRGPTVVGLLDQYLPAGSQLTIATPRLPQTQPGRFAALSNIRLTTVDADPTERADLEAPQPGGFQHIVVLADDDATSERADGRTLVTLLHLRDIKQRHHHGYAIVGEITEDANRGLAQVTRADDFVVSTKMISLLMAQLSRNTHLAGIFAELFDPTGADIYLKPATDYLADGTTANFATVLEAARRRGETAIGYRRDHDAYQPPAYVVVLNPDKDTPLAFTAHDRVIVLADR